MARILRPTTIISDALYVPRAADRQLAQIIEDMGRPGYVLVARQMGKTNLLLHMKRRREEVGDVVVYVDLSERFETARACLRQIIDIALETHNDTFASVGEKILADRESRQTEAAPEFGQHVRMLINAIPDRKLIIILDEVDSLINCGYGDTILAQVRSTYFQRTNYAEYERITYVLSGVAEPTDLIKDKNISPFNIGEKIYLSDFSRDECGEFFDRANLNVRKAVIDAVYYWASGNPRMTWEICAAIEQDVEVGGTPSAKSVETAVKQLYLTDFDRPPVDHIRSLVANDNALKSALASIRYGKGNTLDAKIKGRLYLAGITSSPATDVEIKNRVIDSTLSDAWLAQAGGSATNALTLASEHFVGKRYRFVVEGLRAIQGERGSELPPQSQLELGISLFYIDDFKGAAIALQIAIGQLDGENLTTALYYLGSALHLSGSLEESVAILERAATGTGSFVLPSRILLASAYYHSSRPDADERGTALRVELMDEIGRESDHNRLSKDVLTSSIYELAISTGAFGDKDAAREYFELALSLAPVEMRPAVAVASVSYQDEQNAKIAAIKLAADAVIVHALPFSLDGEKMLAFRERTLAALMLYLVEEQQYDQVSDLLDYADGLYKQKTPAAILLSLARLLQENGEGSMLPLLRYIEAQQERLGLDGPRRLILLRLLAMNSPLGEREGYQVQYFSLFEQLDELEPLTEDDVVFVILAVQNAGSIGRTQEAIRYVDIVAPWLMRAKNSFWALVLLYFKMNSLRQANKILLAREVAGTLLEIEVDLDQEELNAAEMGTFVEGALTQARGLVAEMNPVILDIYRGIGRNQKVIITEPDGSNERTAKFKTVEALIRNGKLLMVQALPVNNKR